MAIYKYLDISTRHLSEASRDYLDGGGGQSVIVYPHDYGWWVYAHQEFDGEDADDVPHDLRDVCAYAVAHECQYIKFDADGDDIEALPTFEWSDGSSTDNIIAA